MRSQYTARDVRAGMMSNPVTQYRILYYKYALTTVKARVLNKLLHSLLDGKI